MTHSLIVYSRLQSPYACCRAPIYQLEQDFGIEVEWRPYSLHIPDFLGTVEVDGEGKIVGGTRNEQLMATDPLSLYGCATSRQGHRPGSDD